MVLGFFFKVIQRSLIPNTALGVTQLHAYQVLWFMDSLLLLTKSMETGLGSQCIQRSESLPEWIYGKDEKESTTWSQIIQTLSLMHQLLSKIKQFLRSLPKLLFRVSPFWSWSSLTNTNPIQINTVQLQNLKGASNLGHLFRMMAFNDGDFQGKMFQHSVSWGLFSYRTSPKDLLKKLMNIGSERNSIIVQSHILICPVLSTLQP